MSDNPKVSGSGQSRFMRHGMMACCAVMLLPVAWYFVAGGAIGGTANGLIAFLPLLLCVGAHFLMHKMMGQSCHGASQDEEPTKTSPMMTIDQSDNRLCKGL